MNTHWQIWTVWNPNHGPATFKHPSYESAIAEAERLAAIHKGEVFHVMQSMGIAQVQKPAVFVPFNTPDEVPF